MTNSAKNLMIRVITKRINAGENFEEIILKYPKLTVEEIEELREAIVM